jgi:hypothetical protein
VPVAAVADEAVVVAADEADEADEAAVAAASEVVAPASARFFTSSGWQP